MEIFPNVYRFDTGPFNWYLVQENGRLTLVDAGLPGHYRILLAGLHSIGHELKDIEAIILTHAHADHTGFAEYVRQETNVPVFVHKADRAALGRILQLPWRGLILNAWHLPIARIFVHAISHSLLAMPHITQAYSFEDNDVLDVPGRPQVWHLPGHTPGEVVFYLPNTGILFSGDTLITRNFLTGQGQQPQIPNGILNVNRQQARCSIERLREIGHVTLLPGHGEPWTGNLAAAIDIAYRTSTN